MIYNDEHTKTTKAFVTNNRSMEYNLDEVYIDVNGFAAVNRKIISSFQLGMECFDDLLKLLSLELNLIKSCEISHVSKSGSGIQFTQTVGSHKEDKTVIVDIACDEYGSIQIFILYNLINDHVNDILAKIIDFFKVNKDKNVETINTFNMIVQTERGFELKKIPMHNMEREGFLEENYNNSMIEFDKKICDKLKDNSTGLVLMHGDPGTGKTNYIRYLIGSDLGNRKIIYVPPDMAHTISSPAFVSFMLDNKDSVLIIEDAENVLKERVQAEGQAVANLLNLTDGLLGNALRCSVICTFNCDESVIDPALLRKGRLIGKYKFDALTLDKTSNLFAKLGKIPDPDKPLVPMTLGEIYNYDDTEFAHVKPVKTKMGFYQ